MNRSEIEKISKALADETRLRIFEAISATKHMNCGEIVSMRGATPATVSHQDADRPLSPQRSRAAQDFLPWLHRSFRDDRRVAAVSV